MPLDPVTELEGVVDAFEAAGVGYAVCGGLALAVHGYPRATMDIDLLVRSEEIAGAVAVAKLAGRPQDLVDLAKLAGTLDDDPG
jgi:hypothetical protein